MALRSIVKYGDPILREKCSEVKMFNERLGIVIDDMKETMIKADGVGFGCSANRNVTSYLRRES